MLKIRVAEGGDLSRLLELYREPNELYSSVEVLGKEEAKRRFDEVLADEHQQTLVAEEDGRIVGTLVLVVIPNLAHGGAPYSVVENVVVDAPRRGEGKGESLIREALELARSTGAYKLTLSANLQRERAHDFYRRLGFRETHLGFEVTL